MVKITDSLTMARTREFDADKAIDQALEVFWKNGYKRASLALLTEATGLHKGSLYGTFKSKENLFSLCLDRYTGNTKTSFLDSQLSPREYIERFFSAKLNSSKSRKSKGCLLMNSCVELATSTDKVDKKKLNRLLENVQVNLESAVEAGIERREFAQKIQAPAMAERLLALAFTIEEMGKLGKGKDFLRNIANATLKDLDITI